jgi:DNA replication protein DnaC
MKAKAECPLCHGRGVILDPDPCAPAKICGCSVGLQGGAARGVPARYAGVSMEGFLKWWKGRFSDEMVLGELDEAHRQMENEMSRVSIPMDLQNKITMVLDKCRGKNERGWKSVAPAQEPNGFGALKTWIQKDHAGVAICWIDGEPGSGRSSLAAAALSAWCGHCRRPGLFVSVRTFGQELKDTYYDTRSWQNVGFQSERDRTAPLEAAPCLVLDDFDRMDSDIRVVRAFAQLLDHRWGNELPTIITASRWAETLESDRDTYSIMKLEDASTLNRLSQARRVELVPTLARLMKSL